MDLSNRFSCWARMCVASLLRHNNSKFSIFKTIFTTSAVQQQTNKKNLKQKPNKKPTTENTNKNQQKPDPEKKLPTQNPGNPGVITGDLSTATFEQSRVGGNLPGWDDPKKWKDMGGYQWKIHHLKMYFLFKMEIFHCCVCLPEVTHFFNGRIFLLFLPGVIFNLDVWCFALFIFCFGLGRIMVTFWSFDKDRGIFSWGPEKRPKKMEELEDLEVLKPCAV